MRPVLFSLIALVVLGGCVRRFEEPRIDEPHAVVKVRVVHHDTPGPELTESVMWNEFGVATPRPVGGLPRESLRTLRVRPEASRWGFATTYFHTVTRMEQRTQYRTEQYACGTETSGYGTHQSTRTRYCTRQVPYQQWVTVTDQVIDGACRTGVVHQPQAGAMYLVQYDFYGANRCSAQCLRQLPATDGTFRFVPCGASEPPPGAVASGGEVALPLEPPPVYREQPR